MTISLARKFHLFTLFATFMFIVACSRSEQSDRIYQKISPYNYEDTLLNLDIAISEHNYRIIHRSHIGQAIRDRGSKNYPLSVVINFCNITYAKKMMDINPELINVMPCTITVREQKHTVIIGTRLMDEDSLDARQNAFAKQINDNLKSIVAATIE